MLRALQWIAEDQVRYYARWGRFCIDDLGCLGRDLSGNGYRFRLIPHAEEIAASPSGHRFAVVAFPEQPSFSGHRIFVIDDNFTVWASAHRRQGGLDVFPDPETLRREWTKFD